MNTDPQKNNNKQLHQAEALAFLEVLDNTVLPHVWHTVCELVGPSAADCNGGD